MTVEEASEKIRRRYVGDGDTESRIWVFPDSQPSPFLQESQAFGPESSRIEVIDSFGGRKPWRVDSRSIQESVTIPFAPTVLLDSQMVSYLREFLRPENKNADRRRAVLEFLHWVNYVGYDYNPVFYFTESVAKDETDSFFRWAPQAMEAILALHAMDVSEFARNGEVRVDPVLLERYLDEEEASSLEEIASQRAQRMYDQGRAWRSELEPFHGVTYAVLLKIVLLHRDRSLNLAQKYEALRRFLDEDVGIQMARELCLALYYFAGKVPEKFIPFEKNLGLDGIRRKVTSSVWDLFLLRMPELLLMNPMDGQVVVAYPCTIEKPMHVVGRSVYLAAVEGLSPQPRTPRPHLSMDWSEIRSVLGEHFDTISWDSADRRARSAGPGDGLTGLRVDPADLVHRMEEEVKSFWGWASRRLRCS